MAWLGHGLADSAIIREPLAKIHCMHASAWSPSMICSCFTRLPSVSRVTVFAIVALLSLAGLFPSCGGAGEPSVSEGEEEPLSAGELTARGMARFRDNKITESIADFERAAQLEPKSRPHLWQLGISYYYAGKFAEGRKLFELHQQVNPDDVENAAWHFLCTARADGLEAARRHLIAIDTSRDRRVPMAEIYLFYAGKGTVTKILAASKAAKTPRAKMYAHLYLGLYYEVAGDSKKARRHLEESASAMLRNNYMHDVAKVHLLQRGWKK